MGGMSSQLARNHCHAEDNAMPENEDPNVSPGESPPTQQPPVSQDPEKEARTWAMFCHLAGLGGMMVPLGNVIGPLIVWLIKKDEYPLVDREGKKALNFQITVAIAAAVCIPLAFVLIGIFLLAALGIVNLVFIILASIRTSNGETFEYPWSIKLIK